MVEEVLIIYADEIVDPTEFEAILTEDKLDDFIDFWKEKLEKENSKVDITRGENFISFKLYRDKSADGWKHFEFYKFDLKMLNKF